GDVVGVGGGVERAEGARIGGRMVNVGVAALPAPLRAAAQTTLRECVLKARPLSFAVGWVWWVWGGWLAVHLLLAALFPGALQACVQAMGERPLATTLLSLLAVPLVLLVLTLLVATGVGVLAVPFFLAALLCAAVLGKNAVLVQLGGRLLRVGGIRRVPPAAAFAAGLGLVTALYLVPVVGLLTWMVLGLWALGGAFAALIRRDLRPVAAGTGILAEEGARPARSFPPAGAPFSPAADRPASPTSEPDSAPTLPAPRPDPESARPAAVGMSPESAPESPGAEPSQVPLLGPAVTPRGPGPSGRGRDPVADLALPRAPFWPRAGALILDWLPLLLLVGILPEGPDPMGSLLRVGLGLAYYAWFLTWRGTTPGGLIFRLRVIRTDGRPLDRSTALVRSAGAVLSFLALGLGWLWPLWDPGRQTWHDRLAGTVVVRDNDPGPLV
ncbi:MAG: RDD family protein, partial [Verrucomicrobiota bacterium]